MKIKIKKSLRMKLVKLTIKEFALNHLFDQFSDDWAIELQNKLKDTFSFKCEFLKFAAINSVLTGEIGIEKENGEIGIIHFAIHPSIDAIIEKN